MAESEDIAWAFINSTHTSVKTNLYALAERLRKQENFTEILLTAPVSKSISGTYMCSWLESQWETAKCYAAPMPGRVPGKTGILPIRIRQLGYIISGSKLWELHLRVTCHKPVT